MRVSLGLTLVLLAVAEVALPVACQAANGRAAPKSSASFGGPTTAGTAQQFVELPKDDNVLDIATDLMVDELNRKQPSEDRSKQSVLSGSKQSLRTGDIYHAKVLLVGGSKGAEYAEGSVFHGVNGRKTVLKLETGRVDPMELAALVKEMPAEEISSASGAVAADSSNTLPTEVEFDIGFLDGIEVQEAEGATMGSTRGSRHAKPPHIDSAAIRRLQMQVDVPLKPRSSRSPQKSRLTKA